MDDYDRGGHSKYSMKVHIIFVTKYRKKIFRPGSLADDVKRFLYNAQKNMDTLLFKWRQTKIMYTFYLDIALKYLYQTL